MSLFLSCSRCDLFEIFGKLRLVDKIINPTAFVMVSLALGSLFVWLCPRPAPKTLEKAARQAERAVRVTLPARCLLLSPTVTMRGGRVQRPARAATATEQEPKQQMPPMPQSLHGVTVGVTPQAAGDGVAQLGQVPDGAGRE